MKNDFEFPPSNCFAIKLITVFECFISSNLKIRKKTLNSFLKGNSMIAKLIVVEIILKVRWIKTIPIYHLILYSALSFFLHI